MNEAAQQPSPKPNDGADLWELVIIDAKAGYGPMAAILRDMEARRRFGMEKYKTPLQVGNGRDFLTDAIQEALDLTVYVKGQIEQGDKTPMLKTLYASAMSMAVKLRALIDRRK
jgi:hypothetical protein